MGIQIFPEIAAAGGGLNFELIASATPTSGESVSFSSIDPKYKVLKLIGKCVWAVSTDAPSLKFNNSGSNYQSGASEQAGATFTFSQDTGQIAMGTAQRARTSFVAYIFESNYATAKNVTGESNTNASFGKFNGTWNDTTVVDRVDIVKFFGTGSTFTTGSFFYLLGSE
jgi:hypothetical protein